MKSRNSRMCCYMAEKKNNLAPGTEAFKSYVNGVEGPIILKVNSIFFKPKTLKVRLSPRNPNANLLMLWSEIGEITKKVDSNARENGGLPLNELWIYVLPNFNKHEPDYYYQKYRFS
jgi:hypothetical protein